MRKNLQKFSGQRIVAETLKNEKEGIPDLKKFVSPQVGLIKFSSDNIFMDSKLNHDAKDDSKWGKDLWL